MREATLAVAKKISVLFSTIPFDNKPTLPAS